MSLLIRYKLKNISIPLVITGFATAAFICIIASSWHYMNLIFGFLIGATVFVTLYFSTEPFFTYLTKKFNLLISISVLSLYYVIVILVISSFYIFLSNINNIGYMIDNFSRFFINRQMMYGLIFGLIISIIVNFLFTINTLLGNNVLVNLLFGRYHNPRFENRFFLLIDIKSSTNIAEKTGPIKFMSLLNDFFYDASIPVILTGGEIYKYVGDEIIISWKEKKGLKKNNAIRFYFLLKDQIEKNNQKYLDRYGQKPEFRAAANFGQLASGELGYLKKEIAFMGDTLNTASRILEQCKIYGYDFLISEDVVNKTSINCGFIIRELEPVILRGKTKETRLYAVERK